MRKKGVYTLEHYKEEDQANLLKKRKIGRRAKEVICAVEKYIKNLENKTILDVGTADGKLLDILKEHYPNNKFYGLEYSFELIKNSKNKQTIICGDGTQMPYLDKSIDVIFSTAALEHIEAPALFLKESFRILKDNGIIIATTPHKFWIRLAEILGIEPENEHYITFNISSLKDIFSKNNFSIIDCYKFMFFPFEFSFEKSFEKLLTDIGFNFLLMNQIIVSRKCVN